MSSTASSAPSAAQLTLPSDQQASGRSLGGEELNLLEQVVSSGTLTSTKGTMVKEFEKRFAGLYGVPHAYACASGTAAIHCAVAAVDPQPGDEIITSPVTDMGAITPILYQGAIPVFADVDPATCNVTPESVERAVNERTKAIVVTHLFGNPCDMAGINRVAGRHGIPVIEDCAQAFLARSGGELVGTLGDIGCLSFQQGKHITSGEGGLVLCKDEHLARRMFLFINKGWGYGDAQPDHYFLALNYRMNELQGAVLLAQLDKLAPGVEHRISLAQRLDAALAGLPAVQVPAVREGDVHSYWKYCLRIDERQWPGGCLALGQYLRERGIACAPRYIQKPAFECAVIREQRTFGESRFPFTLARPEAIDYAAEKFSGAWQGLREILVLPWNERYTEQHVDFISETIRSGCTELQRQNRSA